MGNTETSIERCRITSVVQCSGIVFSPDEEDKLGDEKCKLWDMLNFIFDWGKWETTIAPVSR